MPSTRRIAPASLLGSCCALWLAMAGPARAVPLLDTFGGPAGYGPNVLPGNDDGSSMAIDLTEAFPDGLLFFGGPYLTAYVNNNGNITFNGPEFEYTPIMFPIASQPMIAPYWGDVDTRGGGAPDNNGVFWYLEPGRMVVTWHNVGYYSIHDDHKMDFQMILGNGVGCETGDFEVEFRYNRCEWTTGDASGGTGGFGGTPAQAGFDAGNLFDFVEIPGSRTAAILNLCTTSNVGLPGIWRFGVHGGTVTCPETGAPCEVIGGTSGCGLGVTQCVGREVVCSPVSGPTPERCDGLDNDCDGAADNAEGLCAAPTICVQGACVPPCFEGGCLTDQTCTDSGACVETACLDVTCPLGERCVHGSCVGSCDGVVCPHGQQCFAGRCTDLCDVLTCGEGEVCYNGACVPTCPCHRCEEDEICNADSSCESYGCELTICDHGLYCHNGLCLDACHGAVCPAGQICVMGDCVDGEPPRPDAGPPIEVDAGPIVLPDAGTPIGMDAGSMTTQDAGRRGPPINRGGCGCRAAPRDGLFSWAWALLGLLPLLRRARRAQSGS